jgi:hypothetical protein
MISEYRIMEYVDGTLVPVCLTKADTFWPVFYFLIVNSMFYLAPFVLLVFMYCVIARHLMADPGTNCSERVYSIRARKQVVAMLITVVVAFFLCLLPFRLFTMWIILAPSQILVDIDMDTYHRVLYSCRIMLYLNSAINPMLYNLMSSKFRQGFKNLLPSSMCRSRRRQSHFRPRHMSSTLTHSSTKITILARTGSSLLLRRGKTDVQERHRNGRLREAKTSSRRHGGGGGGEDGDCNISLRDISEANESAENRNTTTVFKFMDQPESFV